MSETNSPHNFPEGFDFSDISEFDPTAQDLAKLLESAVELPGAGSRIFGKVSDPVRELVHDVPVASMPGYEMRVIKNTSTGELTILGVPDELKVNTSWTIKFSDPNGEPTIEENERGFMSWVQDPDQKKVVTQRAYFVLENGLQDKATKDAKRKAIAEKRQANRSQPDE